MKRIFSWKEGDSWCGGKLLTNSQINQLLKVLDWKYQVFVSTQQYSDEGNIVRCPIYIDIDSDNPSLALDSARECARLLFNDFGVYPRVFFSGRKGYHLSIPYLIEHPRCHEIVKHYACEVLDISTIDPKVYRIGALFRIAGSPASQYGHYKVELTPDEFKTLRQTEIYELSKTRRLIDSYSFDPNHLNVEDIDYLIDIATHSLSKEDTREFKSHSTYVWTPCLERMLVRPDEGNRHWQIFILTRFFRAIGKSDTQALQIFLKNPLWKKYYLEDIDMQRTIRSVYTSKDESTIGCFGNSVTADVMKSYCDKLCQFSEYMRNMDVQI